MLAAVEISNHLPELRRPVARLGFAFLLSLIFLLFTGVIETASAQDQILEPAMPAERAPAEATTNVKPETKSAAKPGDPPAAPPSPPLKTTFIPTMNVGFSASPEAAKFVSVCDTVRIENRGEFTFTPMETRLLCGDSKDDSVGKPWSKIPPNEAAYFLIGFFQNRGYHEPVFIQDGETLFVRPGPLSRLDKFVIRGGPQTWDPPRRRFIRGEPLTPALLDDLQGWSLSQIKDEGYACATVTSKADPRTGEGRVVLDTGEPKLIVGVETVGENELRESTLSRYNAFLVGSLYHERLVSLTRTRTQQDGFLQTLALTSRCTPEGVIITRDVTLGPARTIRIGAGASTDEGARLRIVAQQNRIGASASSARAETNLSYLNNQVNHQVANALFRWYYSRENERSYVEPSITFERALENAYENEVIEMKALHGWNREYQSGQLELRAGPTWLDSFQSRTEGPSKTSVLLGELDMRWTAHDFEYFGTSPRTGDYVEGNLLVTDRHVAAPFTVQRVQLQGQKLWNIFRYDPPLLVLGMRFQLSSVFSPDKNITTDLPVRFLTFLGGEHDLRGYNRQSLPRSGVGALSGATVSFEARLHRIIVRQVDVFSFLDTGLLGRNDFQLDFPVFMSPGVGLRWESPVGVLRGYVAQRFAIEQKADQEPYDKQYRFGFTFGEEF